MFCFLIHEKRVYCLLRSKDRLPANKLNLACLNDYFKKKKKNEKQYETIRKQVRF